MKNYLLLVFLCSLGLVSCESVEEPIVDPASTKGERLFILSQGRYLTNDARLDLWDMKKDTFYSNVVSPLGDVGNDIQLINGKLYVVLNNSDKIEIVNPDSTADHHSIAFPLGSHPWKIVQLSSTIAAVPEYDAKNLAIVDLTSNTIVATVPFDAGQSSVAALGGKAYVASRSGKIFTFDLATQSISDSGWIGVNPEQIVADSEYNQLIIRTFGNFSDIPGKIYWVDPLTLIAKDSVDANGANVIVTAGNDVDPYVLFGTEVKRLDSHTHTMFSDAMFTKGYYSGYFNAEKNELYMGTAIDFQHEDKVEVFDLTTKTLKKTLNVGVLPVAYVVVK